MEDRFAELTHRLREQEKLTTCQALKESSTSMMHEQLHGGGAAEGLTLKPREAQAQWTEQRRVHVEITGTGRA
jgi:hypothetical protein